MGHDSHHAAAGDKKVPTTVLVISTSRDALTDRSGPTLQRLLEAAGHPLVERDILPDDQAAITARLKDIAEAGEARVVILSGGTGLSRSDGTFEAVSRLIDKPIPGFGELFRMLSYAQIGASAMLSRATAGVMGKLVVFAIPGSPKACELAMSELILPELAHVAYELGKEGPAALTVKEPEEAEAAPAAQDDGFEFKGDRVGDERYGVRIENGTYGAEAPEEELGGAWRQALLALEGAVDHSLTLKTPEALAKLPGVLDVLHSAGEQAVVAFEGESYAVYGFPDLRRPGSKVLMVGQGEDYGEIIALHRWPQKVGVLRRGGGHLWSRGRVGATAEEVTGKDYPGEGRLLAVEGDAVYVIEGGRVYRWDGSRKVAEGSPATALASLVLRWSQR